MLCFEQDPTVLFPSATGGGGGKIHLSYLVLQRYLALIAIYSFITDSGDLLAANSYPKKNFLECHQ